MDRKDLPPTWQHKNVGRIADQFEAAYRAGQPLTLEHVISDNPHLRTELLKELLEIEIELRRADGAQPTVDEYRRRFPEDCALVESVFFPVTVMEDTRIQSLDSDVVKDERPHPARLGRYVIQSLLGRGGFGFVYLAYDPQLDRQVALKVPRPERFTAEQVSRFLQEARTAAKLKHPGLVTVHDVQEEAGLPYIVQEYIKGENLAVWAAAKQPTFDQIAGVLIGIAEALGYAHQQRLTHCDLKLANVLMDQHGQPHVADFGLAVHESVRVSHKGSRFGTPPMMAPEQVRGEGHRLDGRTDIWALGVMLYELLVKQRPFTARNLNELLNEIETLDPRPPRQIDRQVPRDLERICLRCLQKRRTERYNTADDLREDLQAWLDQSADMESSQASTAIFKGASSTHSVQDSSTSTPMKIIPKGLRSFDAEDADFFLDLLPGPRDRDGLPSSIRFWKNRIEENDPDKTFAVGLIYGPSGCGKSSFVKAGLLPRLSDVVLPIYVEATAADTEMRILKQLQKRFPRLSPNLSLPEACAELRKTRASWHRKILIIVDQFEQWLHTHSELKQMQLVDALRQCEGAGLQSILLVRDDFFASVHRLFQELEYPLLEGINYALVDRFDKQHSCKVLTALGRAYGKFDDKLSAPQELFVQQAVDQLAENEKVICVRLALFSDMMKSRSWTQESLAKVGGIGGVGVTFLEETFSAQTAPPSHRLNLNPVRAVLNALLPEQGTDIKGQMKSYDALLKVSGYEHRPTDFDSLLRILDSEVRLITPTEPDELPNQNPGTYGADQSQYYQLSHDYLVPSIREWLTGKQKLTYRGRAQLKLEDYAGLWSQHGTEARFLPGVVDLLSIRLWTRPAEWNDAQSRMMRHATRSMLRRATVVVVVSLMLALAGVWGVQRVRSQMHRMEVDRLVQQLWSSEWKRLPELIQQSDVLRSTIVPNLNSALVAGSLQSDRRARAAVLLGPDLSPAVNDYSRQLLDIPLDAIPFATERLKSFGPQIANHLLATVPLDELTHERRLAYGVLLAAFAPSNEKIQSLASDIADELIAADPLEIGKWVEALLPIGQQLAVPLEAKFRGADADRRAVATIALQYFIRNASAAYPDEFVMGLVLNADQRQYPIMLSALECIDSERAKAELRELVGRELPLEDSPTAAAMIRKKANACGALYFLGDEEVLWHHLDRSEDPRLQTQLIADAMSLRIPIGQILRQLEAHKSESMSYGLALALESYVKAGLSPEEKRSIRQTLERVVEQTDLYAVRSSCIHLLSVLSPESHEELIANFWDAGKPIDLSERCMITIAAPGTFQIGSPETEKGRDPQYESLQPANIGYDFAISALEVTASQFAQYDPGFEQAHLVAPAPLSPATNVSAYDAIKYCRWLSEKANVPEWEMCYPELNAIGPEMTLVPDYYLRTGFRLPRELEWEYAVRAGTTTSRFFGHQDHDIMGYACFALNSNEQTRTIASFRPNPFGMFDVYGNVSEWCHVEPARGTEWGFVSRGGSYRSTPRFVRSASVYVGDPREGISVSGFRIAQTIRKD